MLRHAADGSPNAAIAERLHLAEGTVRNYLSSAIAKIGARNRIEAAAKNKRPVARAINLYDGEVTNEAVAETFELPYSARFQVA